jgi:hypothetical protein
MARAAATLLSLAFVALLAFLTMAVALERGLTLMVVVAVVVVAILFFGVLGALGSTRR